MQDFLRRSAWAIGLAGAISIAFGFAILIWPHITISIFIKAFGLLALFQGAGMIVASISGRQRHSSWPLTLLWGAFGVLAGIYVFANPTISAVALLFIFAAYSLVRGVLDIAIGVAMHDEIEHDWLYIVSGVVSVIFGLYIFAKPQTGALAVIWLIGVYSLLVGVLYIATAFKFRHLSSASKV